MTLSTLVNKENHSGKHLITYVCVTLFCLIFYLIYDRFSHGVRSPYMTFLFLWPLVLGVLPGLAIMLLHFRRPGRWSGNLYHSGVAALTVSSALRGIFEIAGTASDYQEFLMFAGAALWFFGSIAYLAKK